MLGISGVSGIMHNQNAENCHMGHCATLSMLHHYQFIVEMAHMWLLLSVLCLHSGM